MENIIIKVKTNLDKISDIVTQRLPIQREYVLNKIICLHWLKKSNIKHQMKEKDVKIEMGQYQYRCSQQIEELLCLLCTLDTIETNDLKIKQERKSIVHEIQKLIEIADKVKVQSDKLFRFMEEYVLGTSSKVNIECENESHESKEKENNEEENIISNENDISLNEMPPTQEETPSDAMTNGNGLSKINCDEKNETEKDENKDIIHTTEYINKLPLWNPRHYCQYINTNDFNGLRLSIHVPGIREKDIKIFYLPRKNILEISGHKFPLPRDMVKSNNNNENTYGRFVLYKGLDVYNIDLNTDDITYSLEGDDFVIYIPRYIKRKAVNDSWYDHYPLSSFPRTSSNSYGICW